MAKTKSDWLKEAKEFGLKMTDKDKIADIKVAIEKAAPKKHSKEGPKDGNTKKTDKDTNKTDKEGQVAKAGKRSAKALAEAEEKAEKEERRETAKEEEAAKKPKPQIIRKPRIERAGKRYQAVSKLVEKGKEYSSKEAIELTLKASTVKFDATVEVHIRLGVDPKQADQNIRETLVLPAGTGKSLKVAVYGEADEVAAAKKAGADIAGGDEFLQQLDKGIINFDVLIASPMVMKNLGKYARILGPKGLMPNPKSGTVTKNVTKAISEAKAGKVELRVDEAGIVHLGFGKVSFGADKLFQNLQAVFASLKAAKPSSIKGNFVESIYITSSMGPSVKLPVSEV